MDNLAINKYKDTAIYLLQLYFPELNRTEIEYAVDRSIDENLKRHPATVVNSYKKTNIDIDLVDLANYILAKEPILTSYGVLYNKHNDVPNPLYKLIDSFISSRDEVKKKMFTYPKGSFEYQKYSLMQLLYKLDANAIYGGMGMCTSYFYNYYTAAAITTQGKSFNCAMSLFFESFLANNVPFDSLDEVVTFIYNVCNDEYDISMDIHINHKPDVAETFFKIMSSCGFAMFQMKKI